MRIIRSTTNKEAPWIKKEEFEGWFDDVPRVGERFMFTTNTLEVHTSQVISCNVEKWGWGFLTRKDKESPNITSWNMIWDEKLFKEYQDTIDARLKRSHRGTFGQEVNVQDVIAIVRGKK